jgi:gliding motility-associated-like protein
LSQAQFLRASDYSVIVTDANGCTISQDFTISEPAELIVTTESTDADDGCNGTVTILPLGGAENYNYRWPQLPAQGNNPVARGLCPGIYEIEIFDDNNCQTITPTAEVRDRRFPCLSERNVITPNGDGLNEAFILFCTDGSEASDNDLEIYNRWGQLVYTIGSYNCSEDGGLNCFEGRTNDGSILPEGPYYYVLNYFNPLGDRRQKRGSITIVLE